MRAAIFTEGSSTTSQSTESYSEYFEGSFLSVNTLADELSRCCDTELHILSETYGYVRGADEVKPDNSFNAKEATEHFRDSLLSRLNDFDVVVLLFTTDSFEEIVTPHWEQIVENAKPNSIWCIGTSRKALNSVDLESLESQHPVLIYQRRGVARVGKEVREELIEHIRTQLDE
ncbi:hypothetical protein [Halorarius halobius]|uniref:hypothetical protein n=1 Tax=Halorarius halobius TaxID=2962671 RepID=UPI0020CB714C|nr:hypothetical protein [Halorarius halobius]